MTPDAIRCRQLIEALKLARAGDWQEVDRYLTLDTLSGAERAGDVVVLSEQGAVIRHDLSVQMFMPCRALVTRIEITPPEVLVRRCYVGQRPVVGYNDMVRAPATSLMANLRLFMVAHGELIEIHFLHPRVTPITNPTALFDELPVTVRIWGCGFR